MDYDQTIREWIRKQLQEYGLTPDTLSKRLEWRLSAPTIERLLNGRLKWSAVPKDDKAEIAPLLEEALGSLPRPENSRNSKKANFRPTTRERPLAHEGVSRLFEDIDKQAQDIQSQEDLKHIEPIFGHCSKCSRQITNPEGRCSNCGRNSDVH